MRYAVRTICSALDPVPPRLFPLVLLALAELICGARAAETDLKPDLVVAADGSGDFTTVAAAVASIRADNRERRIVFIKPGVYREKVRVDANNVTLRGADRATTRIEFPQGATEFRAHPDAVGIGILNINGDDCVVQNLTIENTQGVIGVHAFAVYGRGDRTVIEDCNVLSQGNDTLSLWCTGDRQFDDGGRAHSSVNGRYYHARLKVRGSVDFICPRGWCYIKDSEIFEVNPRAEAAIWHDGSRDRNMKFVLRGCRFDGVAGWQLARHHHDAQFYLLDCTFSATMRDAPPRRVVYPLGGKPATAADRKRNAELDQTNVWGERFYFWNCHRDGGDYPWHRDNLATSTNTVKADLITPAWTFDGQWDPESSVGPAIRAVSRQNDHVVVTFTESVTVRGRPQLQWANGAHGDYISGSGTTTLVFAAPTQADTTASDPVAVNGGAIIATEASAALRFASLRFP